MRRLSRQLGARDAVLDGELVAFDEEGRPSFERLQQRIHQTAESVVRRRMKTHPVTYVIFDLLYLDGHDLIDEPYARRRELLERLELAGESWQTPGYSTGHAEELLAASAEQGLEGIVLKRLDSAYSPGKRTGAWLKVKNLGRQEFVIGGWLPGEGRRKRPPRGAPARLLRGRGTGESALRRQSRHRLLRARPRPSCSSGCAPLAREDEPLRRQARGRGRAPTSSSRELVAEIEFRELTAEGMVRHGSFKGLREDKPAAEVELERPL